MSSREVCIMSWREVKGHILQSKDKNNEHLLPTGGTVENKESRDLDVGNEVEWCVVSYQGAWRSMKKMVELPNVSTKGFVGTGTERVKWRHLMGRGNELPAERPTFMPAVVGAL